MKKLAISFITICFVFVGCKKDKDSEKYSPVKITILNQTIGTAGSSANTKSYGLNEDGVNTSSNVSDLDYYFTASNPAGGNGTVQVRFVANDYHLLFTQTSQSVFMKRYLVGDEVANPDAQGNRGNLGNDGLVLNAGTPTYIPLNSISYIGISYAHGFGFLNGWIKIQTYNDYHTCKIISYALGTEENKPVKIED